MDLKYLISFGDQVPLNQFKPDDTISILSFSSDGRFLASGDYAGRAVIFQMIPEANKKISFPAIQIFSTFLQKFPDNTDIYFQLGGVSQLSKIFKEGAFEVKRQALNIVFSLLSNALPENKFLLIQMPNLIESLIEMTNDVN